MREYQPLRDLEGDQKMEGCTDLEQERTCDLENIDNAYKKLSKEVNLEKNKATGSDEAFKKVTKAFKYSSPVHPYFLEVDNFYDYKSPMITKEYGIEFYVRSSAEFDEKYHVGTNVRTDI
nr:chaperone protein DnaJ 49 [Tanacetum cinerariifolium]